MAKTTKKSVKKANARKKAAKKASSAKKTTRDRARAAESLDCLVELHKLQGVLLKQLSKDI